MAIEQPQQLHEWLFDSHKKLNTDIVIALFHRHEFTIDRPAAGLAAGAPQSRTARTNAEQ
jgi:hypothetical protein